MHNARQREPLTEQNPNNPSSPIFRAQHPPAPDPIEVTATVDANQFRSNLETAELTSLVKTLVHHIGSLRKEQRLLQYEMSDLRTHLVESTIYTFVDWKERVIKIGWSRKFNKSGSGRKATHERKGLEYLSHESGRPQCNEEDLKNTLRVLDNCRDDDLFTPRRGTTEEFKISKELIDVLVAQRWPLGDDPYALLDDSRQTSLL